MTQIAIKMAPEVEEVTILRKVKSGVISLAKGGGGVYLRFDCDCMDALPFCKARCCSIPGLVITQKEIDETGLMHTSQDGESEELPRKSSGYCMYNDSKTCLCTVYDKRPFTCQVFHCTRSGGTRGWLLQLDRLDGGT